MIISTKSATVIGLKVYEINVETDTINSIPQVSIIGLPDTAISEAKERLRLAIKNSGYSFPSTKVVINLAPADLKKEGSSYDLAMAVGILSKEGTIKEFDNKKTAFIGELSLDGSIRAVNGVLPIVCGLDELGIKKIILPSDNLKEASFIENIETLGADNLSQVVEYLNGNCELKKLKQNINDFLIKEEHYSVDFAQVKGQAIAKKALEIAAAGAHNVLMSGSPGSGKTMLSRAFMSILPPLTPKEAIELTKIYSISGLLDSKNPLMTSRPFRTPHHSASAVGIIGGGSNPKPGEITLAHRGVLFLDELVEFPRTTLEVLRQPLEDNVVTISRAQTSVQYPANFILIGAMNPCPCGFLGDSKKQCTCSEAQINRYKSRLSGPLLDRIDIQLKIQRLNEDELLSNNIEAESSATIRQRVIKARKIQLKRYENDGILTNSELDSKLIKKYCKINDTTKQFLKNAINQFNLSARAYDRLLKISRTIADLEEKEDIELSHIAQALQLRSF